MFVILDLHSACIYDDNGEMIPQFYEGYPQIYIDDKLWVDDDEKMEFKEWVNSDKGKQDRKSSNKFTEH